MTTDLRRGTTSAASSREEGVAERSDRDRVGSRIIARACACGWWVSIAAIAMLATANFLWRLGSSSLYTDEGWSWFSAVAPAGELGERVRVNEVAPPVYYYGLHEWIGRGGTDAEWWMRLPSALAGVLLVGAVMWLAMLVADRRVALLAGLLAALSPLFVVYAQQVRAYVFAALCAVVAVAAAAAAERSLDGRRTRWLTVCVVAAGAALWLHYTALLAIAPLAVWLASRRNVQPRVRLGYLCVLALTLVPLVPLTLDQMSRGHEAGVAPAARLTLANAVEVAGAPMFGRDEALNPLVLLFAAVVVGSILTVARWGRGPLRSLVMPVALTAPIAVVLATLLSDDVLLVRYVVVAAPFTLVVVAGAARALPPRGALVAATALAAVAAWGSVRSHATVYPDYRAALHDVRGRMQPGDAVFVWGLLGPVFDYYARGLPAFERLSIEDTAAATRLVAERRRRFWAIATSAPPARQLRVTLAAEHYRLAFASRHAGLAVFLAEPDPP